MRPHFELLTALKNNISFKINRAYSAQKRKKNIALENTNFFGTLKTKIVLWLKIEKEKKR